LPGVVAGNRVHELKSGVHPQQVERPADVHGEERAPGGVLGALAGPPLVDPDREALAEVVPRAELVTSPRRVPIRPAQPQPATVAEDAFDLGEHGRRRSCVLQHVRAEDTVEAPVAKRKMLGVGDDRAVNRSVARVEFGEIGIDGHNRGPRAPQGLRVVAGAGSEVQDPRPAHRLRERFDRLRGESLIEGSRALPLAEEQSKQLEPFAPFLSEALAYLRRQHPVGHRNHIDCTCPRTLRGSRYHREALNQQRPLRIAFVSWRSLAHAQAGGSEVLVDRLAKGLMARGHEVALLCGGPADNNIYDVRSIGGTYTQYLRAPIAHARRYRQWDLVVDVENGVPFFSPLWRRGNVVGLVHHIHRDQWPLRFPAPIARAGWFLESRVMPRVYESVLFGVISTSTARALADLGVDPSYIRLVPIGTDFPPDPAPPKGTEPRFLAFGRLVPHKRIDLLLRVWKTVRDSTGGTLVVAGDGPDADRLHDLSGPGVEFRGAVSELEKWRLLQDAQLLIHPALHEGWGMVIMEAAACGTPAIGFDVDGVRDSIVDGVTGVLVRSEAELAAQWIALAHDQARQVALGAAAFARAKQFTWDITVDRFLDLALEALTRTAVAR